ncbi:hypothetical protein KFK09_025162 [Dendrobium nobile]|uniref:Uncharacterized protein n=1 Tax=Dendrobium nobile TaxID=94219 RepID=A0A8T3ALA7_DENNO|nr:hypothetical protein KFK09_025162 [Dendrobium nobile]
MASSKNALYMMLAAVFFIIFFVQAEGRRFVPTLPAMGLAENSQPTTMKSGEVFEMKPKIHPPGSSGHSNFHHGPGVGATGHARRLLRRFK